MVLRSAAEMETTFGIPAPGGIDWEHAWVIAYDRGAGAPDGTRAAIARARLHAGGIEITTRLSTPAGGCAAPPQFSQRIALVQIERTLLESEVSEPPSVAPTADEVSCARLAAAARRLDELAATFDGLAGRMGTIVDLAPDRSATLALADRLLLDDDDGDEAFGAAARSILLAFRSGHTYLSSVNMPFEYTSYWGVCARPSGDGAVVTHTSPTTPLGLVPGDLIVAVNNEAAWMLDTAWRRGLSGPGTASASNRRTVGAVSLFAALPGGSRLRVRTPTGQLRTVTVPSRPPSEFLSCTDPLGRARDFDAKTTIRPDGIAVIRLPALTPQAPTGDVTAQMRAAIQLAFDEAKAAPGIVWDLRANAGGITPLGYEIVGGMPGARATLVHSFLRRTAFSDPPEYPPPAAMLSVTPGGSFAYTGKVAVLVDGLTISAGDYFALAVRTATDVPLVGTPGAGAFGSSIDADLDVSADPETDATGDLYRAFDADGHPIEGLAAEPTVFVELDPADLAAGIDTQLEAAVALVR